jgi:hypothetical protein
MLTCKYFLLLHVTILKHFARQAVVSWSLPDLSIKQAYGCKSDSTMA